MLPSDLLVLIAVLAALPRTPLNYMIFYFVNRLGYVSVK